MFSIQNVFNRFLNNKKNKDKNVKKRNRSFRTVQNSNFDLIFLHSDLITRLSRIYRRYINYKYMRRIRRYMINLIVN